MNFVHDDPEFRDLVRNVAEDRVRRNAPATLHPLSKFRFGPFAVLPMAKAWQASDTR